MNFEFHGEKEFQIQYYLYLAHKIETNLFGKGRHIVLPYLTDNYWYFPDYNLFADPKFREEIHTLSKEPYFNFYNEYLYTEVANVFDEFISDKEVQKDRLRVSKGQKQIENFMYNLFGDNSKISQIYIIPTKIGTIGTFGNSCDEDGKITLYCTYRLGHIEHLPATILAGYIQSYCNFNETIFQDFVGRQKLIEFFQSYTKLGEIFGKPKSLTTLQIMDGDKSQYIIDSAKYLAKMGYPAQSCLSYDKDNIYFNGKAILGMQEKEFQVLKLLIDRKNTIVSFDDIAQAYWKIDWREKFSLFGITKVIEKIRKSLIANGIKVEVISTIRKRGYSLYD